MGVCRIQHKKIYDLFQKISKRFTKKACVLGSTLSLKLSTIMIAMSVLENIFEIRAERIRRGSKPNWYEEEKSSESFFN